MVVRETYSVCPVCKLHIPAQHVREGQETFLVKTCPEHGTYRTVIWRGKVDMEQWRGDLPMIQPGENLQCPTNCGLCEEHRQQTCCVLLEITGRCNLHCKFCFASELETKDPSLEEVKRSLDGLIKPNQTLVQLSGGEPTVREDLPEIIAYAKEKGCKYVQLNSNGLRLTDPDYVRVLAEAGLSFVFLQFDGVTDDVYQTLRGKPLLKEKMQAIENCARYNVGVTLVPTLVPGVNTHQIGAILDKAISLSPAVRGVHFQPVSYFGRYPQPPQDAMRFTLDELVEEIPKQTQGRILKENLLPSRCDHPMCGFHGDFIVLPNGIKALSQKKQSDCCCCVPAEKNREFIARRWKRPSQTGESSTEINTFDGFLKRVQSHGFTVTAMAFQDCYNLDLERLRRCSLHVYRDGKFIPFCANYLTCEG